MLNISMWMSKKPSWPDQYLPVRWRKHSFWWEQKISKHSSDSLIPHFETPRRLIPVLDLVIVQAATYTKFDLWHTDKLFEQI